MTRCPDCDAPMAQDADLRPDCAPVPADDLLCWRTFHGDACQREAVDWRARALEAETKVERLDADYRAWAEFVADVEANVADARQAHADSAEVLAQVAAERDQAQEEAVWWQAGAQAIVNLFDPLKARVTDPGFALTIARAAKEAHRTVRVERDRLREEVAARDRALDACAERIADLLGQYWPATLGRNLATAGALCMSRVAAIGLVDGFWAWQPGRGKPHPGVHEVEVP